MWRNVLFFSLFMLAGTTSAQTMTFSTSNSDYVVTNVFSDVDNFEFTVVIDAPLAAGVYDNPDIVSVDYRVQGTLALGTPSDFTSFELIRSISGEEFYLQGSSLSFEISNSAVLSDGVQVAELVGSEVVFSFNGRENNNGRFHPALFQLRADGTGRIQNSNNVVTEVPLLQVEFGDEYINDLMFDAGNTTLITSDDTPGSGGGGGGAVSLWMIIVLLVLASRRWAHALRPANILRVRTPLFRG